MFRKHGERICLLYLFTSFPHQLSKFQCVCINDTLNWCEHVWLASSTVSRNLNLLRRLSWFVPKVALLVFYCSYILPSFNYCDVVWGYCIKDEAASLECLQNFAARTILRQCCSYSASSARRELSLSTMSSRRDLAQHSYKAIRGLHPRYLQSLFTHYSWSLYQTGFYGQCPSSPAQDHIWGKGFQLPWCCHLELFANQCSHCIYHFCF